MSSFVIRPAAPVMPDALFDLAIEADGHSIYNVSTLIDRWVDGSERYDRPGESLLVAQTTSDVVVGVGGLSQCPDVADALRVRRFYVAIDWRRQGVARALAERLIEEGLRHTTTLTCNARASAAAPPFWEAMGFTPIDAEGITHIRSA